MPPSVSPRTTRATPTRAQRRLSPYEGPQPHRCEPVTSATATAKIGATPATATGPSSPAVAVALPADGPCRTAAAARRRVSARSAGRSRIFLVVVGIYIAGLVFWLVLGLLPTLAHVCEPVRNWAMSLAMSSSPLAPMAARILSSDQSMAGMSMDVASTGSVLIAYAFSALNLVLGLILVARRSRELVPQLLALALLGTAATFNKPSHSVFHIIGEPWPVKVVHFMFHIVSGVAYVWAVVLFPDGRLPRQLRLEGKRLAGVVALVTTLIAVVCWRSSFIDHPLFFVVFFGVAVSVAGLCAQALRISDPASSATERRSCRLLGAALLPAFVTGVLWLGARVAGEVGGTVAPGTAHFGTSLENVFPAVFAVVPVVLFFGILRYRLWDIDWLLSRALLYGTLAVVIGAVYVVGVSAIGLGAGGGLWATVVVLSLVAVAVDPLRRWLRGWLNTLFYGQVLSPAQAVQTMLASLDRLTPGTDLSELTRVVVEATRASRCELWLTSGDHLLRVAAFPEEETGPLPPTTCGSYTDERRGLHVPIVFHDRDLGSLFVEFQGNGVLGPVQSALVSNLAAHAGAVVHNAVLNAELARHVTLLSEHVEELRASRRRLVAAQDTERRDLERNLHDGAQQSLVAVLIGLQTAKALKASPERRQAEIDDIRRLLEHTAATLGELISDTGPSALARYGLAGALTEAGQLASRSGVEVRVSSSITSDLAPDVATAVYFCCLEALQNSAKHARATSVVVTLSEGDGVLRFRVSDDGAGFDPSRTGAGSGLGNLGSRVTVIGGDVAVESAPGCGTTVRGSLPIAWPLVTA